MPARELMPALYYASDDGAVHPYDPDEHGHMLDLEPNDDSTPLVVLDWIVQILGFNPLTDPLFASDITQSRRGLPWQGTAGQGMEWHDKVRQGVARRGMASHGGAGLGPAGQGRVWHGAAGRGTGDAFVETEHPRGQPENKGEFSKGKGNVGSDPEAKRNTATTKGGGRGLGTTHTGHKPGANTGTSNPVLGGGRSAVVFSRTVSTKFFRNISDATQASDAGAAVHVYEPGEYRGMKCYLTQDGSAGYALKGDDIVSVFKHPDSPHKKVAISALAEAVKRGGRRLDCFDTVLPGFYSNNHFRAVARIKFNDEYAPEGWDYDRMAPFNKGRPDVVFMVYDPSHSDLYKPGDGELVDDYDEAESIQKDAVKYGAKASSPRDLHVSGGDAGFVPAQHPRGQPKNKGEFAKTSGGASTAAPVATKPATPGTAASATQSPALFSPEDMALPVNASQPVNTPEAIQQGTIAAQDQLATWLNKGKGVGSTLGYTTMTSAPENTDLNQPGGMLFIAPPKSTKRAAEKVQSDYGGDWSKLLDPVRCSFACDNFGEVRRVLQALQASGMKLARRPKDRFAKPTEAGYRDCLLNVVMPNGMIAEVQLHTKAMLQAKAEGHQWYEIERTLDAESKTRNLTVEERQQKTAAGEQMNRIYADAWAAATQGVSHDALMVAERYSYYSYNNTYFRRINRNDSRRSIDEVLHGDRWVPYTGDCLEPVVFGDRCDDPFAPPTGDADFKESDHPRGQPENKGEFAKSSGEASSAAPSTAKPKMTLTEARREAGSSHATIGSLRRAGERLRDEISKLRKLPSKSDVVNLVQSHEDKLEVIERRLTEYGDTLDHPRVRKMASSPDKYNKKQLHEALNWIYENRMDGDGELKPADQKLVAAINAELDDRIRTKIKSDKDRATDFAYMTFPEVSEATGIEVTNDGGHRGPTIRAGLSRLPESHIEQFARTGVKIKYVNSIPPMPANHAYAPGMVPAGLYRPDTNTVEVSDEIKLPDGSSRLVYGLKHVLRHELGHAMDASTGLSYNRKIIDAYTKAFDRMTPEEKKRASYFMGTSAPPGAEGEMQRLEMYAELYAYSYNDGTEEDDPNASFGGINDSRRFDIFAPVRKVVREETDNYLATTAKARRMNKENDERMAKEDAEREKYLKEAREKQA